MIGQTSGIEKHAKATGAMAADYTVVKFGADDDTIDVAAAVTDAAIGIAQHSVSGAGERVRIMMTGISRAIAGGTITRGNPLTMTTGGQVVAAAPGAGTNNYIIGFALASAVANDVIPVLLAPGRIQG